MKTSGMTFEIKDDNTKKIIAETDQRVETALFSVGLQWQRNVSKIIKQENIIDTGRLLGSMSFAVGTNSKAPNKSSANESNDFVSRSINDKTLTAGTNVEYAAALERGIPSMQRPARPFLEPSWTMYRSQYERLIRKVLGSNL